MSRPLPPVGSADTTHLLDNLSLAVDKARLVRKIISLSNSLKLIQRMPKQSNRIGFLKSELLELEQKLSEIVNRV